MKNLKDTIEINESKITWANVHDAVLNVLMKYYRKFGISKDVTDYCDKIKEALEKIQH